uniref:6-cysteine protein n=1 Tax=Parastrongyloides trichosuri TaxID=131310 RepID=A0A0N4Z4F9_PARTI
MSQAGLDIKDKETAKYDFIRCSLAECDIDMLYITTETLNLEVHIDIYQIFLYSPSGNNLLIFHWVKRGHFNYSLVPCPQEKWYLTLNDTKYKSRDYVKTNFPSPTNDNSRHSYVPLFKREEFPRGDAFICGEIVQKEVPDILVGFGIIEGDSYNVGVSKIEPYSNKSQNKCNIDVITNGYLYEIVPSSHLHNETEEVIHFIDGVFKFHSGAVYFTYNKPKITHSRAKYGSTIRDMDIGYYEQHFEAHYPISVCKVEDIPLDVSLKIGESLIFPRIQKEKEKCVKYFYIEKSIKPSDGPISCNFIYNKSLGEEYSNFYDFRYDIFIKKEKDDLKQVGLWKPTKFIEIQENHKDLFGTYSCLLMTELKKERKFFEIKILPAYSKNTIINVTSSKSDKNALNCHLTNFQHENLTEMIINLPNKKTVSVNITAGITNKDFTKLKTKVIYYPHRKDYFNDITKVTCKYSNKNYSKSEFEINVSFKDDKNYEKKENKDNDLEHFFLIGMAFVFLAFFIIILSIIKKMRNKTRSYMYDTPNIKRHHTKTKDSSKISTTSCDTETFFSPSQIIKTEDTQDSE